MLTYNSAHIETLIAHFVGNPVQDEPLKISENPIKIEPGQEEYLLKFLLKGFEPKGFYHFNTNLNVVYDVVKSMFTTPEMMDEGYVFDAKTEEIASHLYDVTTHPKIPSGDLFIGKINQVNLHNEFYDCIVIVKCEEQDNVLELTGDTSRELTITEGYPMKKITKGALIFSGQPSEGYRILLIDKGRDFGYWSDSFLECDPVQDSFSRLTQKLRLSTGL